MGDNKAETLAKARIELEEMYSGIPEESIDLTFRHLANLTQNLTRHSNSSSSSSLPSSSNVTQNTTNNIETTTVVNLDQPQNNNNITLLKTIPTFDFSKSLEQTSNYIHNYDHHDHGHDQGHGHRHHHRRLERINEGGMASHPFSHSHNRNHNPHNNIIGDQYHHHHHHHHGLHTSNGPSGSYSCVAKSGFRHAAGMEDGDVSMAASVVVGRQRRPGIPHSKICALCNTYTYIFRHRCLVCGRVYCRQCVGIGMGEMTEGRKCLECLGKRFSQRYIHKAGEVGCFCARYPSEVRQTELKWAEKGPKRSFGRSRIVSRSRSPIGPRNSNGPQMSTEFNSFAMSSTYSPYTPSHHHYPF